MRSTSEAGVRLSVMLDSYRQRTISGSDKTMSTFARLGVVFADTNERNNRPMIASFCFKTFAIFLFTIQIRATVGVLVIRKYNLPLFGSTFDPKLHPEVCL